MLRVVINLYFRF